MTERSPLLPLYHKPAHRFINIRVFTLGILFIGGVTIGSYLLYEQGMDSSMSSLIPFLFQYCTFTGRSMSIHHIFELISREEWDEKPLPPGNRLISSNVVYILTYQTGGNNCFNLTDCARLLKHMQVELS